VTDHPDSLTREEVARLLRQQMEMGAGDLVVDEGSREALMQAVRTLAGSAALHPPTATSRNAAPSTTPAPGPSAGERAAEKGRKAREQTGGSMTAALKEAVGKAEDEAARRSSSKKAAAELPILDTSAMGYDELREAAMGCTRCGLSETRQQVVFSDGNPDARLVVVGEAPGANEDKTGLPFVGAAGKLLDLMLGSVDLSREESVYICNVLKCRPPGNRNPEPSEIRTCSPFLKRQVELVKPDALLAVGTFAAQLLTGRDSALGKLRGEVHSYEGIPLVVTYHPAALMRNSGWVRPTWDDLQLLRSIMDGK